MIRLSHVFCVEGLVGARVNADVECVYVGVSEQGFPLQI